MRCAEEAPEGFHLKNKKIIPSLSYSKPACLFIPNSDSAEILRELSWDNLGHLIYYNDSEHDSDFDYDSYPSDSI